MWLMETWQKYLSMVTQMFLQVKERWIHATSLSVMLEGKICFVSIEKCLLLFPLPCLAFHSWWELWLSHVIFNEVHFLSYMEPPAPYVPKFGHLSTKEGSFVTRSSMSTKPIWVKMMLLEVSLNHSKGRWPGLYLSFLCGATHLFCLYV